MMNDNAAQDTQSVHAIFSEFGQSTKGRQRRHTAPQIGVVPHVKHNEHEQHQGKIVFRTDLMG